MTFSVFHVWAIVRLSSNMQNLVVNRFRRRSDAEECLRLLRHSMPGRNYTIVYAPLEIDLGVIMEVTPQDWAMYSTGGNKAVTEMMQEVRKALSHQPLPQVRSLLKGKVESVAKAYPEIQDTEVRNIIETRLTNWACQVHELPRLSALPTDYWNL